MPDKINMHVEDGDAFYAHELSMNFNPTQIVLDFKNITPRMDLRGGEQGRIHLKHNVILLDPYHAKQIVGLMNNVLKKYEENFGKIDKPKPIKHLEKSKKKKPSLSEKTETPTYFG